MLKKTALALAAAALGAALSARPVLAGGGSCDSTCIAPPNLVYEAPEASTAQFAYNAENAVSAKNCTGGLTGHCYPGATPPSTPGAQVNYAPYPPGTESLGTWTWTSSNGVADFRNTATLTYTPWASYLGTTLLALLPPSPSARATQADWTNELPNARLSPSPTSSSEKSTLMYSTITDTWTDNQTATYTLTITRQDVGGGPCPPSLPNCP